MGSVEDMRRAGRSYLKKNPGAFGGSSSSKKSTSVKAGQGVYYDIDDINKTAQVRDGSGGFTKVTEPVVVVRKGRSNRSSGTTNAQIIEQAVTRDQSNKNVLNYERSQELSGRLGYGQSTAVSPLVANWYQKEKTKTGSSYIPDINTIKRTEERGEISRDTALKGMAVSYQQDYQKQYSKDFNAFNEDLFRDQTKERENALAGFQARIDSGEDYNAINKEYNTFIKNQDNKIRLSQQGFTKNWEETTGAKNKQAVNKILYDQNLLYNTQKAKDKVFKSFGSGAVTGAVTTGGFQVLQKYAPKLAKGVAKVVAVPLMVGYGAYAYGTSGRDVRLNYKQARSLGFTKLESVQRGTLAGANTLSGPAFYSAGALTGGLAVSGSTIAYKNLRTTGRFTGYSSAEQVRLNKILGRKDAVKIDLAKGQVSDAKLSSGGKSISGSTSTRAYDVTINKAGLSGKDLKVANKFNLRGRLYQQSTSAGKGFSGIEAGKFKTGGLFGRTTTTFSNIQGVSKGGKVLGLSNSITRTGNVYKVSQGAFVGKGSVKYPNQFTRLEGSSVKTQTLFEGTYTKNPTKLIQLGTRGGKWSGFSTTGGPIKTSATGIQSNLQSNTGVVGNGYIGNVKNYWDVAQWKPGTNTNIQVSKTPSKTFSSGSSGQGQIVQQVTKFRPMAPVSTSNIQTQSFQATRTAPVSAYAGRGTYERTGGQVLRPKVAGPSVSVGLLPPRTALLPLQPQVRDKGPKIAGRGRSAKAYKPVQVPAVAQLSRNIQRPKTRQGGRLIQSTNNPVLVSPLLTGGFGFGGPKPPRPAVVPGISLPLGAWGQAGYGRAGAGKIKTDYNPSFTAQFFKIEGTKPKGVRTGIGFRPIVRRVRRVRK